MHFSSGSFFAFTPPSVAPTILYSSHSSFCLSSCYFSVCLFILHYCQIPLLACVPLAWGPVCWQDLWRAIMPGRPIWLAADRVGCSKSITVRGANRIDYMTTHSLGCEANVIPALFIPPSIRISSKRLALWFPLFAVHRWLFFFWAQRVGRVG